MIEFSSEVLKGEYGGMLAMAFASGCVAGYSFAQRTIITAAKSQIQVCNKKILELEKKVDELQTQLLEEVRNK